MAGLILTHGRTSPLRLRAVHPVCSRCTVFGMTSRAAETEASSSRSQSDACIPIRHLATRTDDFHQRGAQTRRAPAAGLSIPRLPALGKRAQHDRDPVVHRPCITPAMSPHRHRQRDTHRQVPRAGGGDGLYTHAAPRQNRSARSSADCWGVPPPLRAYLVACSRYLTSAKLSSDEVDTAVRDNSRRQPKQSGLQGTAHPAHASSA